MENGSKEIVEEAKNSGTGNRTPGSAECIPQVLRARNVGHYTIPDVVIANSSSNHTYISYPSGTFSVKPQLPTHIICRGERSHDQNRRMLQDGRNFDDGIIASSPLFICDILPYPSYAQACACFWAHIRMRGSRHQYGTAPGHMKATQFE
jgi:hypothetical protein